MCVSVCGVCVRARALAVRLPDAWLRGVRLGGAVASAWYERSSRQLFGLGGLAWH